MPEACPVDEDSDEFQDVVKDFYDTLQDNHNKIRIIKVRFNTVAHLDVCQCMCNSDSFFSVSKTLIFLLVFRVKTCEFNTTFGIKTFVH